jgi:hypothetical protein
MSAVLDAREEEAALGDGLARAENLPTRAIDDVVFCILAEPSQRHGAPVRLAWPGSAGAAARCEPALYFG